jgi:hypothetical protein
MPRLFRSTIISLVLLVAPAVSSTSAHADTATLVSIRTPRGATQAFILIKPDKPVASVILFAGGHGALGLRTASSMAWGDGNFLVRSRDAFAAHGLIVAVVDAPSDQPQGMSALFRMGSAHAGDIGAVAADLKRQADVPVWLIGTSMGTFSAAGGAIAGRGIDGLVLTSTITRARPEWKIARSHPDGVASMALDRITVPTLVVSHRNDGCSLTPASDAAKLTKRMTKARKVEVALLGGGDPPQSAPCEAKSQHGFLGIEAKAVDTVAAFIETNGK